MTFPVYQAAPGLRVQSRVWGMVKVVEASQASVIVEQMGTRFALNPNTMVTV